MTKTSILDLFDRATEAASEVPEDVPEGMDTDACSRAMTWWEGQIRAALERVLDDAEYEGRLGTPAAPAV